MARRAAYLLVLLAGVALLAAGCGRSNKPYTAAATAPCLKDKGYAKVTTNPVKVGFIAGFAENGGVKANASDGNVVTIAFAANEAGVPSTEEAFRNHASAFYKKHLRDIMESFRNAVLVWQTAPTSQQIADVQACLKS